MGYNGDVENQKRNPKDYIEDVEDLTEIANGRTEKKTKNPLEIVKDLILKDSRGKYNSESIVIHTGSEDPEDSIDPEDWKLHVWVNPENNQPFKRKDGTTKAVSDPNIKIIGSDKINDLRDQMAILEVIEESEEFKQNGDLFKRNMRSYLREWVAHNFVGKALTDVQELSKGELDFSRVIDRTKDVDLNYIDKYGVAYDRDMFGRYLLEELKKEW